MKKRTNLCISIKLTYLVKPLTGFMILAVFGGIAGHLCAAFIPILGGYAFLGLLGYPVPFSLTGVTVLVLMSAILRGAFHYGEQACNHYIAFKLLALIRCRVFAALRKLCPAKLEGRDKGNLISVITADIELLEVFYAHTISPAVIALLMSVVMCILLGSFHWLFGLLGAAAYLAVGVVMPLVTSKRSGDQGIRFRSMSGELGSFMLDSLRGLTEIQQFGAGKARLQEIDSRSKALSKTEEAQKMRSGKNTAVTNTVILLFDMAMLMLASLLYIKGQVAFDGVLIPVIALMSSFGPVIALSNLGSGLQNTFAAGERILTILEEAPAAEEITGKPGYDFEGACTENVTFSYGGEKILSGVTLGIPPHSIVGITGKSGSGKSTLLKLLMRFWSVQQGQILISGQKIQEINTWNLREMQSLLTQETHLFHDSIANNLRIAKKDATREEMERACRKASVHDFIIKLPQGYDTPVGELGSTLSGGERQRLGLARAFLHDAPFLLLDEPTSNLDSLNEAVILKSVGEERGSKTVVLVSHRASTMRLADTVYSVENGRTS